MIGHASMVVIGDNREGYMDDWVCMVVIGR